MGIVYVVLAEGFEEIEAVTAIDLMRRANIDVRSLSITGEKQVLGSRRISLVADEVMDGTINIEETDMIVLPGGCLGRDNMVASKELCDTLKQMEKQEKRIAAICAAPTVLGRLGLLKDVECVCYPDEEFYDDIKERKTPNNKITTITDGLITTSIGPATAMEFGLELIRILKGEEIANQVSEGLLYKG